MDILLSPIGQAAIGVIVIILGVLSLTRIYSYLKNTKQGYPNEEEIEEVLLPIVYNAILSAYRVSEWTLDKFGEQLNGVDKKAIADSLYRILPAVIVINGVCVPVKQAISEKQFSKLVQSTFDTFVSFYNTNEDLLMGAIECWLNENK